MAEAPGSTLEFLRHLEPKAPVLPEPSLPSFYEVECRKGEIPFVAEHEANLTTLGILRTAYHALKAEVNKLLDERKYLIGLIILWSETARKALDESDSNGFEDAMSHREVHLGEYDDCMLRINIFCMLNARSEGRG